MDRLNFDDIIKNKLNILQENIQEADWELFEKKISAQNEEIDEVAFEKLKDLKIPFDAKSWTPLARRIEAEFNWMNIVFKFKLIELSFLLLIPFFWESPTTNKGYNNIEVITPSLEKTIQKTVSVKLNEKSEKNIPSPIIPLKGSEYQLKFSKPSIRGPRKEPTQPIETIKNEIAIEEKKVFPKSMPVQKASLFVNLKGISGTEINRIISPLDFENRLLTYDRLDPGFSGGLLFEFGKGIWAFETGFIYSSKNYAPRSTDVYSGTPISGFFRKSMEDFQLNIINIPLNARKELLELNKIKLYGIAGLSLQIAYKTNYALKFDPLSGQGASTVVNFSEGWLEGGSFRDNGYLTVNFGMSFEREISDRWIFFVQPTYQHTAIMFGKGIGPENDRIQTLSLFSGIKVNLYR